MRVHERNISLDIENDFPLMLNEKEAASMLNVSISYLRKSRSEGAIRNRTPGPEFVKIGKLVKYRTSELKRWVEELHTRKHL